MSRIIGLNGSNGHVPSLSGHQQERVLNANATVREVLACVNNALAINMGDGSKLAVLLDRIATRLDALEALHPNTEQAASDPATPDSSNPCATDTPVSGDIEC